MNDDGIAALMRVAQRVSGGEPLTTDLMGQENVPVALRLVVAAITLTASDRPVNKKTITTIAPAARSATYRDHVELLEQAKMVLPAFVQAQLGLATSQLSATELGRQLEEANASIHEERLKRIALEKQLQHIASYARELHQRLKPEFDEIMRERSSKVRHLRSRPVVGDPDESTV